MYVYVYMCTYTCIYILLRPLHTLGMCGITFTAPAHVPIHAIACTRYVWPQRALACIRVYAHAYRAL